MNITRNLAALGCAGLLTCLPAGATNLVTGNGFGFAVVSPETAVITRFYAHPYSFAQPDPRNALGEGIETANFITKLAWSEGPRPDAASYDRDSHVIHVRSTAGEEFVFMPFGLRQTALVIGWEQPPSRGHWDVVWSRPVRSSRVIRLSGGEIELLKFDGIEEALLLIPLGPRAVTTAEQGWLASSTAWALVSLDDERELALKVRDLDHWRHGLSPRALAEREIRELDRWRVKSLPPFTGDKERHLWRQSEVMLRMAQSREPNRPGRHNNGFIVASLPDGVWFTPWVRDMVYAALALARMGHRDEARAALLAYFNAQPTGKMRDQTRGKDYQVSVVRYFGDGSEEPFFTMEGSTNIEYDNWGLVLWLLGEYLQQYDDPSLLRTVTYRGPLYESARDYIVKPLLANLDRCGDGEIVAADTSIWEERQKDKKHFAFSTAAAIAGLQNFAEIAARAGDQPTRAIVLRHVAQLRKGFAAAFIRNGQFHGTLEEGFKNDIDGALLAVINFGVVADRIVVKDTVDRMQLLRVASGGFRRVRSTYTDPSIFEYWYERQEFLFVDFSLAEVDRRLGRDVEAAAILQRIVNKAAADHDIVPEMYVALPCPLFSGAIGDPTGARPMAGYGAGAYILDVLDRAGSATRRGLLSGAPHSSINAVAW